MKEIKVSLESFKLKEFITALKEFVEGIRYEQRTVGRFKDDIGIEYDDSIEYDKGDSRDYKAELKSGYTLFIPFSDTNMGEPIECANGECYYNEEDEDRDILEDTKCSFIGEADFVGYFIKLEDGQLVFNSALELVYMGSLEVENNCGLFDKPMEDFINKYIRKA